MPEVIQSGRKNGYTVLTNTVLRDPRLRLQTKGLFAIMTSFPEGWSYSVAGLCSVTGAGKAAVRSCLDELQAAGYQVGERIAAAEFTLAEIPLPLGGSIPLTIRLRDVVGAGR